MPIKILCRERIPHNTVPTPIRHSQNAITLDTDTIILFAACLLCALFTFLRFSEYVVGSVGDDAVYAEMARSIAEGRGAVIYVSECIKYLPFAFPSGYPFVLSPVALLFPDSLQALQLLSLILPLSAIPFYFVCQHLLASRTVALSAISLFIINPWTITYANRVLSESAYTFFSFLALLTYIKWQQCQSPLSKMLPIVILLVGLSASIRTVGLALMVAMMLHLFIRFKWAHFIVLFVGLTATLTPQFILNTQRGGAIISPGYKNQVVDHVHGLNERFAFMIDNARGYIDELPAALLPIFGNQIRYWAAQHGIADFTAHCQGDMVAAMSLYGCQHSHHALPHSLWRCPTQFFRLAFRCATALTGSRPPHPLYFTSLRRRRRTRQGPIFSTANNTLCSFDSHGSLHRS
jgi:hypothetical protein